MCAIVRRRYVILYALQTRVVIKQILLCRMNSRTLCLYVCMCGEWFEYQRLAGRGAAQNNGRTLENARRMVDDRGRRTMLGCDETLEAQLVGLLFQGA